MAPRVDKPADPESVLIRRWTFSGGSGRYRLVEDCVAVVDVNDQRHRAGSTVALGMNKVHLGEIVGEIHLVTSDDQLGVADPAVVHLEQLAGLFRTEDLFVELESGPAVADGEIRDKWFVHGNSFGCR